MIFQKSGFDLEKVVLTWPVLVLKK